MTEAELVQLEELLLRFQLSGTANAAEPIGKARTIVIRARRRLEKIGA